MSVVKKLCRWYAGKWGYLVALACFVPVISVLAVRAQVAMGNVVDAMRDWQSLITAVGIYCAVLLLQLVVKQGQKATQDALNYSVTRDLRETIAQKILNAKSSELRRYEEGNILQMWNRDVKDVQQFSVDAILAFAISTVSAVLALVQLGQFSILFPIIALLVNMITLLPLYALGNRNKTASQELRNARVKMNDAFYAILDNIRVVKAFGKEKWEVERFGKLNDQYLDSKMNAFVMSRLFKSIVAAINSIAPTVVMILVSLRMTGPMFSVGNIVTAIALMSTASQPFRDAGNFFVGLKSIGFKVETLDAFFQTQEEKKEGQPLTESMDIVLDHVQYEAGGNTILEDISLRIHNGQNVAVVGESGSGKSTLCKVIARILEPTAGNILVNGLVLEKYSLDEYRKRIYFSQSNIYLPHETVMENLTMFGATEDAVRALARAVDFDGDIEALDNGYETRIDASASNLSGGQKKKLEVIRTLTTQRSLYFFDEIISGMDSAAAQKTMDYLIDHVRGTKIFILHNLAQMARMDQIVVMEEGRIVAVGNHDDLLESCPQYCELIQNSDKA